MHVPGGVGQRGDRLQLVLVRPQSTLNAARIRSLVADGLQGPVLVPRNRARDIGLLRVKRTAVRRAANRVTADKIGHTYAADLADSLQSIVDDLESSFVRYGGVTDRTLTFGSRDSCGQRPVTLAANMLDEPSANDLPKTRSASLPCGAMSALFQDDRWPYIWRSTAIRAVSRPD
jgi:hypothetical protein